MTRQLVFTIVLTAIVATMAIGAQIKPVVLIDGELLQTSPKPVIQGGRIYIPAYSIRKIGLRVEWQPEYGRVEIAWPESDGFIYAQQGRLWIPYYKEGGPDQLLPGKPFYKQGRLMIPIRALADKSGSMLTLEWNRKKSTANLRREQRWLNWRLTIDGQLRQGSPGCYEKPL